MMKKFTFLMPAIVALLASCSQEDTLQTEADSKLQTVTITTAASESMRTRANAQGDNEVTRCLIQILEKTEESNLQPLDGYGTPKKMTGSETNGFSTTAILNPIKKYTILFWADAAPDTYDISGGLQAVKMKDNKMPGIAYAGKTDWGGNNVSPSIDVDLKHVVSKLTLRTTEAVTGGKNYSLEIPTTFTAYNVLSGTLLEPSAGGTTYDYTVPAGGVAKDGDLFSIYLLAGSETQELTLTNDGAESKIPNVPLAPNKHTILKGDVQNAGFRKVTFTATVVEQWDSEETKYIIPGDAVKITPENCNNISGDGNYVVGGTFNNQISVTGGSPTIYLESASINVGDGPAINITSGTPTIHVMGENTIETSESLSNCSSGIYVAQGSSVTIEGNGTDDVLRVTGGADGAAIGGYHDSDDKPCGDIVIKNVTLHAYAVNNYMFAYAPGIGATGGTCGRIEISSAIVYARSFGSEAYSAPAIGAYESVPEIVITDSEIHAYRGSYGTSYADYIGQGGSMMDYQGGQIQYGSGSITGSTIYKYTYNASTGSSSSDGSEAY